MKKWVLKAIIQKLISGLPGSHKINYLFQKYITKGVRLSDQYFEDKLTHAIDHLQYLHKHAEKKQGFEVLELGSGWYPVVPVAMFLAGAKETISLDITPLMEEKGVRETIDRFLLLHRQKKLQELEQFVVPERLTALAAALEAEDLPALLKRIHLKLEIRDARKTSFEDDYFDLICSNNVFEHIYPDVLKDIIKEFQRILKSGAVASHFIDMSDHFAHLDKGISIYNFLRFSDAQWKWIDNSVQPQNRLRYSDYLRMYRNMSIKLLEVKAREGRPEELQYLNLDKRYRDMLEQELAISHMHLVHSKK